MHPGWLRNPEGEDKIKRDSRLYLNKDTGEPRQGKTLKLSAVTRNNTRDAANTK